jgi:protein-disulfide isomerase
MENWKIIVTVLVGSVLLVVLAAFGLSKTTPVGGAKTIDNNELLAGARWIKDVENPKVTVVEFSDMQCPACKAAQPFAEEVKKMNGVKFVLRHFPLIQLHKNAWAGARAAEAARMMGKGDDYVNKLFDRQSEWSSLDNPEEKFVSYAKELGLLEDDFLKKLKSDETDKLVGEDYALGNRLKLQGTPTFYVNVEQVSDNFLKSKVEDLLKK